MRLPQMTIRRWIIAVAIAAVLMGVAVLYERLRAIPYDPLWRSSNANAPFWSSEDYSTDEVDP